MEKVLLVIAIEKNTLYWLIDLVWIIKHQTAHDKGKLNIFLEVGDL